MGVLNFSTDNLITGVNIIDGNLYWTDNNSEPKKLEIDRFRDYNHDNNQTTIGLSNVIESDLSVIRLHPWKVIDLELTPYADILDPGFDDTQPEPPFEQIFPRFSYRWRYEDGQYSPYAPFTQAAFIPKTRSLVDAGTPDQDGYRPRTEVANYIEGFNTTMFNNVGRIVLNNIPRGPRDVVAIELLYTESISSTIYVLETIDIPEGQRGLDYVISPSYTGGAPVEPIYDDMGALTNGTDVSYDLLPLRYELSARKIYSALPANQLTRPYDEVPQKALSQEITANRLIYGNYQIGFDQSESLQITTEFISTENPFDDGLHVKGNRTYEIGVAYIDAYGRQGAMTQAGSITLDNGLIEEQIPITSGFFSDLGRRQIQATITSPAPEWADRYRYFIKDPSMDHHNLISYNIYNDGGAGDIDSEFIWIEFQSTDRNKVQAEDQTDQGTVLVLRRVNDDIAEDKIRFLVQDIQNEAPDDVRSQIEQTVTNTSINRIGTVNASGFSIETPGNVNTRFSTSLRDSIDGVNFQTYLNVFNRYLEQNGYTDSLEHETDTSNTDSQIFNLPGGSGMSGTGDGEIPGDASPLIVKWENDDDVYVQVLRMTRQRTVVDGENRDSITLEYGDRYSIDEESGEITRLDTTGLVSVPDGNDDLELFTSSVSDEAVRRLGGRFWVRTARNGLETVRSQFSFDGELEELQQIWFETEPIVADSQLDLFWESSETFCVCTEHGWPNAINWFNCIAEVKDEGDSRGVYLEATRTFNKFNSIQLVKGVRANVPTGRNEVIERPYGLTWSGIYNSRTSVNRLNQFITADGITKELEPNYGSLQKLHTRDTNLIAFCEDKIFRILADKDLLFNADGGGNVSAANAVLGQTTPFVGEYGISRNPESFASYGHNIYCSDAKRGVVLQITPINGQIFEISNRGLNDFFRDRLAGADRIIGMFDDYSDKYIISAQGYDGTNIMIDPLDRLPEEVDNTDANVTWGYEIQTEGWPSRMSFIPEAGLTLNNRFYTWKNGLLYMHNAPGDRNTFYEEFIPSSIQVVFNDNPSAVKEFLTLGYEGTPGWEVTQIDTENEDTAIGSIWDFTSKEGKFFAPIVSTEDIYVIDPAGTIESDDGTMLSVSGTRDKSGIKGFYNVVTLENDSTDKAELFAINTENFISSN